MGKKNEKKAKTGDAPAAAKVVFERAVRCAVCGAASKSTDDRFRTLARAGETNRFSALDPRRPVRAAALRLKNAERTAA